ncbi:MAG: aminotransferase class I/II-fold pyridoxal phosphate-dependent enzyme [Gammaproteobacteria bacterium]|nr:aminotransferase class I/II-fold pyridoxal phosphate-dependent enzyme [Gammaproteobacteria bacterium]
MIDLRSDTVTLPTPAMRDAMAAAPVGDDVYGDDPTVNALEARTAELLGKEAAVFVPTGTMSNQIGVRAHTEPGDLVLIDRSAHIVRSESGAPAALSGVTLKPLPGRSGVFTAADVDDAIEPEHPFNPIHLESPPRLLCVENTHNGGGGAVWPLGQVEEVCAAARRHGLATHLDGARLWHATAATGIPEARYCAPFDTVNVCFSKGLGAPVGSALAGSRELVARARRFKQQFGGGFRQAGILAAAALHALEHHRDGLPADVANARALARGIARIDGLEVDLDHVQSNLVRFRVTALPAGAFALRCHERELHLLPQGEAGVRAVTHRDISAPDVERALDIMRRALRAPCRG